MASSGEIVVPTPSRALSVLQIVFFRGADLDPLKDQGSCDHPNGMMAMKGPWAIRGQSWPATTRSHGASVVVIDDHGACEEVLQGAPPIIDKHWQEAGEEEKNRHDESEQAHERSS